MKKYKNTIIKRFESYEDIMDYVYGLVQKEDYISVLCDLEDVEELKELAYDEDYRNIDLEISSRKEDYIVSKIKGELFCIEPIIRDKGDKEIMIYGEDSLMVILDYMIEIHGDKILENFTGDRVIILGFNEELEEDDFDEDGFYDESECGCDECKNNSYEDTGNLMSQGLKNIEDNDILQQFILDECAELIEELDLAVCCQNCIDEITLKIMPKLVTMYLAGYIDGFDE